MYKDDNGIYHIDNPKGCLLNLLLIVVALVICAMLGSCKARQTVVRESYAVHDTVWSVRNDVSARRDSIVYYEFTDVRPHVIKLRDTTIVYTDTIIRSVANNTRYVGLWQYRDTGRIVRDTACVDRKVVVSKKENATKEDSHKWRLLAAGIVIGIALSLLWKHRGKLWAVVKRIKC